MSQLEIKSNHYEKIKKAIYYFDENYFDQPKLEDVASYIGMSKHHFSRIFKEYVGVTPMQFLQATTRSHAKEKLQSSNSILDISMDVGLSSSSRLHDLFINFTGLTPNEYKKMGQEITITYGFGYSPFGKTMIATTPKGICVLEFYDDSYDEVLLRLKNNWSKATIIQDNTVAQNLLDTIFIKKEKINLYAKGTNFQINVWQALLQIKKQELTTYSDIATLIGKPKATRAVATAIGSNSIAYLIPCHRVISKSAAFAGYKWGIERKRIVLSYEENHTKEIL